MTLFNLEFLLIIHGGILEIGRVGRVDRRLILIIGEEVLPVPEFLELPHDLGRRIVPKLIIVQL